ncbi:thioredoxin family protein [Magnetospira sp. QH-2]|uniref:thioredoxin family protein n=1 Tax=Magnetospira sp. (strain QH-2) TaxID=1288970 RepID=UPI0003E81492|nr:thioredoxin family protein [Magnetospira sp. QH-2]CCQ73737.1 Thioredoxin SoxW [Magnetospira sp. QH-2]
MFRRSILALAALVLLTLPAQAGGILRDDGVHTESWFKNLSFLDLKEDLQEALDAGKKGLVLVFEQEGCGACQRLHEVNFQEKETIDYVSKNFDIMVINMYGANEVTDFDGEVLAEARFNEKLMVNFSPTTVFFGPEGKEVFRVPGYLAPRFYLKAFEYVVDGGPSKGVLFPRWLKQQRDKAKAANKSS